MSLCPSPLTHLRREAPQTTPGSQGPPSELLVSGMCLMQREQVLPVNSASERVLSCSCCFRNLDVVTGRSGFWKRPSGRVLFCSRHVVFPRLPAASLPQGELQACRDPDTQAVQPLARGGDRVPAPRRTDSKPKGPQETAVGRSAAPVGQRAALHRGPHRASSRTGL